MADADVSAQARCLQAQACLPPQPLRSAMCHKGCEACCAAHRREDRDGRRAVGEPEHDLLRRQDRAEPGTELCPFRGVPHVGW